MDCSAGILTIRGAKFGKSRLVPLHASTCKVLADYVKRRDCRFDARPEGHFLVNKNGNQLDKGEVHRAFYTLSRQIGLRAVDASRGPRLHDFRHRFAVETLLRWYRNGEDPRRRLPVLSTYLGARSRYRHLLVSDRHSRTAGRGRQEAGKKMGGSECGIPLIFLPCCSRSSRFV